MAEANFYVSYKEKHNLNMVVETKLITKIKTPGNIHLGNPQCTTKEIKKESFFSNQLV